jgi:hypothetical protein
VDGKKIGTGCTPPNFNKRMPVLKTKHYSSFIIASRKSTREVLVKWVASH